MKNLLLEVRATNSVTIAGRRPGRRVATAGTLVVMANPGKCEVAQNRRTVAFLLQGNRFRAAKLFGEKPVTLSTISSTWSGIEHGSPPWEMGTQVTSEQIIQKKDVRSLRKKLSKWLGVKRPLKINVKVKQSRYRPGGAQWIPGS